MDDCFSHQHHSITIEHDPNIHFFIQNCLLSQYCFSSDVIVESNVREVKVHSPDYKGVEADEVFLFSYSLEIGHNNIEFTVICL